MEIDGPRLEPAASTRPSRRWRGLPRRASARQSPCPTPSWPSLWLLAKTTAARAVILATAAVSLTPPAQAQEPPARLRNLPFDAAYKHYRAFLVRPSLYKRTQGRLIFSSCPDPRVLPILAKSYARPEEPKDLVRYLIASIATRSFGAPGHRKVLAAWRARHRKPLDAWLWFSILKTPALADDPSTLDLVFGKDKALLRAAALEGLAHGTDASRDGALATRILALLDDLPRRSADRSLLVEACASLLLAKKREVRGPPWQRVFEKLIDALDDRGCLPRTRLVLARHFARLLDCENLGFTPETWRFKLRREPTPPPRKGSTEATFFGIRSMGERFCYVIDTSDSMLTPISGQEKKLLAAITGPRKPGAAGGTPLPWDRIRTRFDAAREFLKQSLRDLRPPQKFAVILFGTDVTQLPTTRLLVAATPKNIAAAIRGLDAIRPGPTAPRRPHGTLHGYTNLHGGMLRAFQLTDKKKIQSLEFVDLKALERGCDTVFLLSDGEPTMDSYSTPDGSDGFNQAGDPETGTGLGKSEMLDYYGPYVERPYHHICDEMQRLNLFRKAEIHCVGFGEADASLLHRIARFGIGRVTLIRPPGKR